MKTLLWGLFASLLVLLLPEASAQITDMNVAINKAGRQRMLSQRMAKSYFQMGLQVDAERSKRVLEQSISLFERQLAELKAYAPTPEIRELYTRLDRDWQVYRVLLLAAPSPDNARKVLAVSEDVLSSAHQATLLLEKQSSIAAGRLVNLSGRQRMLSQRMAKFYQAMAWGVGDEKSAANLEKARKDFIDAHQELNAAAANTRPITEGLALVHQQWIFFDNALSRRAKGDARAQLAVATTSERILEEMETVVGLYEKISK